MTRQEAQQIVKAANAAYPWADARIDTRRALYRRGVDRAVRGYDKAGRSVLVYGMEGLDRFEAEE